MNRYPVHVRARPDAPPGRWLWLVKWLLLLPHYLVLAVLWVAFVALTLVAYVAVLVTGRYPAAIFAFNVGVLRWTWRIGFYGYQMLGTDRYPPFTLAEVPDYPAGLAVDGPPHPPRWLPLVAWLLALPHLLIVAAVTGGTWDAADRTGATVAVPVSLVLVGVLVAGFALLFTGRYPRGLYDLLAGVARWTLRVVAYVALLTDRYPPFRLDQGAGEPEPTGPDSVPAGPAPAGSASAFSAPARSAAAAPARSAAAAPARPAAPAGWSTAPARRTGVVGRILALVAGVLVLLIGLGLGAGGTALLVLDGRRDGGYLVSEPVRLDTTTAALTAEGIEVRVEDTWGLDAAGFGDVRLTVTTAGDRALFLGVAAEDAVDRWLAGTAHEQVVDLFDRSSTRLEPGGRQAVAPPTAQTFWLASTSGTGTLRLDWPLTSGRFAVVLANADGSAGVRADVRAGVRVPDLTPAGAALLTGGALLALAAMVLLYVGATGPGGPSGGPPTGPTPPPAAPPGSPGVSPPAAYRDTRPAVPAGSRGG